MCVRMEGYKVLRLHVKLREVVDTVGYYLIIIFFNIVALPWFKKICIGMPIHVVFKELNAPPPTVHHAETMFILEISIDTENVYDNTHCCLP